jgi:hypothetical protein
MKRWYGKKINTTNAIENTTIDQNKTEWVEKYNQLITHNIKTIHLYNNTGML